MVGDMLVGSSDMIVNCDRSDEATFPSLRRGMIDIGQILTVHPIQWFAQNTATSQPKEAHLAQLANCPVTH